MLTRLLSLSLLVILNLTGVSYAQKKISSTKDGYAIYQNGEEYFLYNKDLEPVTTKSYKHLWFFYGKENSLKYLGFSNLKHASIVGLMDRNGKIILPDVYENILANGYEDTTAFVVSKQKKYGILSYQLKQVIPYEYDKIRFLYRGLPEQEHSGFSTTLNNKEGFISKDYRNIIKPEYDNIRNGFHDIILKKGKKYGLASREGKVTIEPKFDFIDSIWNTKLFIVKENGKYGLIDVYGKEFIPIRYEHLQLSFESWEPYYTVKLNGKYGIVSTENATVLPIEYDTLVTEKWRPRVLYPKKQGLSGIFSPHHKVNIAPSYQSIAITWANDTSFVVKNDGKYGIVSIHNKILVPIQYDSVANQISEGLVGCMKNKKWGIARVDGKEIIAPQFDEVGKVDFGLARVKNEGRYGTIAIDGRVIVEPRYEDVYVNAVLPGQKNYEAGKIDYKYIDFKENGFWGRMNKAGKVIIPAKYHRLGYGDLYSGNETVELNGKIGLVDTSGRELIAPLYQSIREHSLRGIYTCQLNEKYGLFYLKTGKTSQFKYDGFDVYHTDFSRYKLNKKFGILNDKGIEITPPIYDEIYMLTYPYAVKSNNKWGYVDNKGKILTQVIFENAVEFYKGLCPVKVGQLYGVIDSTGKFVLQPKYLNIVNIDENYFKVNNGDKWGVINPKGLEIIKLTHEEIDRYKNGFIVAHTEDWKAILYDKNGKVVIPPTQGYINPINKNYTILGTDGTVRVMDFKGKDIIPPGHEHIEPLDEENQLVAVQLNNKKAIYNIARMQKVTDYKYDHISLIQNNYFVYYNNNLKGLVRADGKEISEAIFDDISRNYIKADMFVVKLKGEYMFLDTAGKLSPYKDPLR